MCAVTLALSTAMSTCVVVIHSRQALHTTYVYKLPGWLHFLVLRILARVVRVDAKCNVSTNKGKVCVSICSHYIDILPN